MSILSHTQLILTPETQRFVDALAAQNAPPINTLSPEKARNTLLEIQSGAISLPDADIEEIVLPESSHQGINIRLVRPAKSKKRLPLILYVHGGGWILGDKKTHDRLVRLLANETEAIVAFPSYTLSPEAQYPVALEEIYASLMHLITCESQYKINSKKIALAGDSVGGNMATALALMIQHRGGAKIAFQCLFYPVTDAAFDTESYEMFAEGPWLTRDAMKWYWNAYLPNENKRNEIYASPLRASIEALRSLPPTFIATAENDVLRDEGEAYAHKLMQAGVPTTAVRYLGTIHDFVMLNDLAESTPTRTAIKQAGAMLYCALHR